MLKGLRLPARLKGLPSHAHHFKSEYHIPGGGGRGGGGEFAGRLLTGKLQLGLLKGLFRCDKVLLTLCIVCQAPETLISEP